MASIEKIKELLKSTETVLELVQQANGELVLRPSGSDSEPLVSIKFSDQVQAVLGDNVQALGQHMIQSAIYMMMEQQSARWHAEVFDVEPAHYS
jgi:endo-alpha-1,4-polygalactosaminidase (GH114 family)